MSNLMGHAPYYDQIVRKSKTKEGYVRGFDIHLELGVSTIALLILNFSSFTTRQINHTNDRDCCCYPWFHIPTDYDPTRLVSRVGI